MTGPAVFAGPSGLPFMNQDSLCLVAGCTPLPRGKHWDSGLFLRGRHPRRNTQNDTETDIW